jgi:hypothetical protein
MNAAVSAIGYSVLLILALFARASLGGESFDGRWSITLPANQWLRFDRPGTYRIYARSTRPQTGSAKATHLSIPGIELVSDIPTIRIMPLTAERERELLARAKAELDQGDEKARSGVETLRYLQTPAARRTLVRLLPKEQATQAVLGLAASRDPNAAANRVLEAAALPESVLQRLQ